MLTILIFEAGAAVILLAALVATLARISCRLEGIRYAVMCSQRKDYRP